MRAFSIGRRLAALLLFLAACLSLGGCSGSAREGTSEAPLSLPAAEETVGAAIRAALLREEAEIDLSGVGTTEDAVDRIYARLLATEPALFFVTPTYTLTCAGAEERRPLHLRPTYRWSGEALAAVRADFAARVDAYIAAGPTACAPLARVADLHDRMILDFSYDDAEEVIDPYTLLVSGRGVCQAYSLLFTALCRAAGVEAYTVTCFPLSHAWNEVKLSGGWYHIDLTWDETVLPYDGRVPHGYFLLTDEELAARRTADDPAWADAHWDAPYACGGPSLAALALQRSFGRGATLDGETLYFAAEHTVYALDCRTLTRRVIYREEAGADTACFSALYPVEGNILCNLPRALLTITPAAEGGEETLSLSHRLESDDALYVGLAISPSGHPLLTALAYRASP